MPRHAWLPGESGRHDGDRIVTSGRGSGMTCVRRAVIVDMHRRSLERRIKPRFEISDLALSGCVDEVLDKTGIAHFPSSSFIYFASHKLCATMNTSKHPVAPNSLKLTH